MEKGKDKKMKKTDSYIKVGVACLSDFLSDHELLNIKRLILNIIKILIC